jgi:16S rRNA (cytidine1402-2'-O)-methyltransferase
VAREITKLHEEFLRGSVSALRSRLQARGTVKGEITLLVSGGSETGPAAREVLQAVLRERLQNHRQSASKLARECASEFNWSRAEVYALILEIQNNAPEPL